MGINKRIFLEKYIRIRSLIFYPFWKHCPQKLAGFLYYKKFKRHIDWEDPKDLNEKINWLKFHYDQTIWAKLSDKFAVREYVAARGLGEILVPLYGKYYDPQAVIDDWNNLPSEFVIKSNNGTGQVLIIDSEYKNRISGDCKEQQKIKSTLRKWLFNKMNGVINAELQYQYINNCIIIEQLLKDDFLIDSPPTDYKFYCADGKVLICYVTYGRNPITHERYANLYDLNWNEKKDYIQKGKIGSTLSKPDNWERLKECASILSKGHPQVRVDLYSINGTVYFGEMTFTSAGGFDNEFVSQLYMELGNAVNLEHPKEIR